MSKPAIILLSGGLDSATVLAMALGDGYDCYCLSFSYGQKHNAELEYAERLAKSMGAKEHRTAQIDIGAFGGSALTDASIDVPDADALSNEIPVTYVPARNTVFLSYALAWAEVLGAKDIFIGVNAVDYSGYPDCRRTTHSSDDSPCYRLDAPSCPISQPHECRLERSTAPQIFSSPRPMV